MNALCVNYLCVYHIKLFKPNSMGDSVSYRLILIIFATQRIEEGHML